jgi:glycosyl hydrolase family 31
LTAHAAVTSHTRRGNLTVITLTDGAAEVSWISESSFRFTRCWSPACLSREPVKEQLGIKMTAPAGTLVWETRYVRLRLNQATLALRAELVSDNSLLFEQEPPSHAKPTGLTASVQLEAAERIYGFAAYGLQAEGKLDVRGERLTTATPLFLSSRGFGMYFGMPGAYEVDAGSADAARLRIRNAQAKQWEQFVYYGPTPKEILEEHHIISGAFAVPSMDDLRRGKPAYSRDIPSIRDLAPAAMSGVLVPATKQGLAWSEYMSGPRWEPYLYTYLCEARDRGIPVVRPLAMQFPNDEQAASVSTSLMIGDEVLIATTGRSYLPPGIWTDLETGQVHRGRQSIETPNPPRRFARNGTILPIQVANGLELHYFPRLGAEFFLSETSDEISQMHAAPAGDQLRLEIESLPARLYGWVVHNVSAPRSLTVIGAPALPYRYDKQRRQLGILVEAPANSDIIINVVLDEPL